MSLALHRSSFLALFVATATFGLVGCQSFESGAKERFGSSHTCPEARVEARRRSDLTISRLREKGTPPADVAKDPERLKMWEAKEAASQASADASCEMWEARGCGAHEFLCCARPKKHANRVSCFSYAAPKGMEW